MFNASMCLRFKFITLHCQSSHVKQCYGSNLSYCIFMPLSIVNFNVLCLSLGGSGIEPDNHYLLKLGHSLMATQA